MNMEKIDLIKKTIKISDYFEKGELEANGDGFRGCCPFHTEKTPSFFINIKDDAEVFYCFGCSKGGDIFSFLQEKEKKDFKEIYTELLEKLGMEDNPKTEKTKKERIKNKTHIDALEKINTFLIQTLWEREDVIEYLINKRGLDKEDIKFFQLGFSEGDILKFIRENEISESVCEDLHLIKKGDNGYYDIVKNRITIPLFSKENHIIGISSRDYKDNSDFKYVNPKDSSVFKKNSFMYGFNLAKDEIKDKDAVILTEGYFDFMSMYKYGIKNTVALMSTSLMADNVKTLSKLTENFYFCMDGDAAGRSAIVKNAKEAIKSGVNIWVIELPEKEDPDTFIRKKGPEEFYKLFKNAKSILDFIASLKEDEIIEALEELKKVIPKISSTIKQQFWYKNIKDVIGINLTLDVKKEFFLRSKDQQLTFNDLLFLKLYTNSDPDTKPVVEKLNIIETEKAKLLYLKLKNTLYNIDLTKEEKEILDSVTLTKKTSQEEIEKVIKRIEEEKRLR